MAEFSQTSKMADEEVQNVKELMAKKDAIEQEIKELYEVLDSQKGVGMQGNLIDSEGYPRADIDVYSVRTARNRIICLQNDHKALMKQIEEGLHRVHAQAREKKRENSDGQQLTDTSTGVPSDLTPFLSVDSMAQGSPASQAGLQIGDKVLKFGSIDSKNFKTVQDVGSVVQHSKGLPLTVTVERQGQILTLSLTPNTWTGRGLLGCHIVPLK